MTNIRAVDMLFLDDLFDMPSGGPLATRAQSSVIDLISIWDLGGNNPAKCWKQSTSGF
jgi:hypothetical protein